jgi:hypothetical protein
MENANRKLPFNPRNDIKPITSLKFLEKVNLDLDSPRLASALTKLGLVEADLKLM